MIFMYVDESGDPGKFDPSVPGGSSEHYILTGLVVPAAEWRRYLDNLVVLRRQIKTRFKLHMREELHGAELINPRANAAYRHIKGGRHTRISLYESVMKSLPAIMPDARIINVHVDKSSPKLGSTKVDEEAWKRLLQRFHNHLVKDRASDSGIVFADETNEVMVRREQRRMRKHNMVPSQFNTGSRNLPTVGLIEDPVMRASHRSYFVQVADLIAHALYREIRGTMRKYNAR